MPKKNNTKSKKEKVEKQEPIVNNVSDNDDVLEIEEVKLTEPSEMEILPEDNEEEKEAPKEEIVVEENIHVDEDTNEERKPNREKKPRKMTYEEMFGHTWMGYGYTE